MLVLSQEKPMIQNYLNFEPQVGSNVYIAPTAIVIGRVSLGDGANVWPGAVLRADIAEIKIGAMTNIQDGTVCHVDTDQPLVVGAFVTVGHGAILHACSVGDRALIGMGAIVLNGAVVGEETIIGAGSLVPPGKKIPPRVLALGAPARVVRELTPDEIAKNQRSAEHYHELARAYMTNAR